MMVVEVTAKNVGTLFEGTIFSFNRFCMKLFKSQKIALDCQRYFGIDLPAVYSPRARW